MAIQFSSSRGHGVTFERRTDSNAGQTRSPARPYAYFMILHKPRQVAGPGGWAELAGVRPRQYCPWKRSTIRLTMSVTSPCSWQNRSIRCAVAS
jgi:hypothetical protein